MTFAEKKAFYNEQELLYPDQSHWNKELTYEFFINVQHADCDMSVLEFGGWKGSTANAVIPEFDVQDYGMILCWDNYDICDACIPKTECNESVYNVQIINDYIWNTGFHKKIYNVFYAVHAIEHIDNEELEKLINTIPESVDWIYLESPLRDDVCDWTGRNNAHVLTYGWNKVIDLLKKKGYDMNFSRDDVKWFIKHSMFRGAIDMES